MTGRLWWIGFCKQLLWPKCLTDLYNDEWNAGTVLMIRVTTPGAVEAAAERQKRFQNRMENHCVKIYKPVWQF